MKQERIAALANQSPEMAFASLAHPMDIELRIARLSAAANSPAAIDDACPHERHLRPIFGIDRCVSI
jgi:hypothetical protein